MRRIDVAVLGRPHVAVDGVPVPLVGRQLALAVRLAIAGQRPVPLHRLADVWPDSGGSDGAIRVALTRLRQAMGAHTVVRVDQGYLLAPSAHIDADRFEELLAFAREATNGLEDRIVAVEAALGLWEGAAYDGFDRAAWVEYEAIRLDELCEHARDLWFELVVERGADDRIIGELSAALARTPERERRSELLALALYRSGRQAAALEVIETTRRRLRDELGLVPGQSLARLERQILEHDPTLMSGGDVEAPARDPRLRSASALLREGIVDDAVTISAEALAAAREAGHRHAIGDALLVHAQAVSIAGEADATPLIDEAKSIARSLGDGRMLARAAIVRFGAGVPPDRTQAMVELGEPLDFLPGDAPERVELLCAAAVIVTFVDLDTAAERVLLAARRTYEAIGDARSEVVWLAAQSIVLSVRGDDVDSADELARRAASIAESIDDPAIATVVIHAQLRYAYSRAEFEQVDGLIERLEVVAERAVLPFGIVRVHLCRITNAMVRGELESVPALIDEAVRTGRRLGTHAVGGATDAQRLALALEREELGDQLEILRMLAAAAPTDGPAVLAAYAGDESDLVLLRRHVSDIPRGSSFSIVVALVALVAGRHRDAELGRWARPHLAALGDRTIFGGFGTLGLGFARFFLGLTDLAMDEPERAKAEFERTCQLSESAGATLWTVHARLHLAEALLDLGDGNAGMAREQIALARAPGIAPEARRADAHARRLESRLAAAEALDSPRRS